jgi:hypothetical protein
MSDYEKLEWEYNEGRITIEQYEQRLKDLKKVSSKRYAHFEAINTAVVRDPEFCRKFPGPLTLYFYLRTLVIRTGPLKDRTYGKGALLSLISQEKMAEQFQVSDRTIRNWIEHLIEQGVIKKAKLKQWGVGRDFQPNLYQVGYINKDGREDYFIDKGYF